MKSKVILFSLLLCIFLTPTSYAQKEGTADYDVLIKNGKVLEALNVVGGIRYNCSITSPALLYQGG